MYCKKYTTALMLFIYFGILSTAVYASKSVFVISSHDNDEIQAYRIDANHVTLQATWSLPAVNPLINLAAWPQKELLFVTHENAPATITYVSTKPPVTVSQFSPGISDLEFAGIVVDTGKGKIYAAQRVTSNLYVYLWNDAQKTLVFDSNHILAGIGTYPNGAYDLALDANGLLYVSDGTKTIHYYSTTTWQAPAGTTGSFDILHNGNPLEPRPAIGIAIDPNRRYLYSGNWPEGGGNAYLVRTTLSNHMSTDTNLGNYKVIGIDVDKTTGLVYCTTTNKDFRVYDSNLTPLNNTSVIGGGDPGVAGVAVGGSYEPPIVRNVTQDHNYTSIQSAIDASTTIDGDTLVASEDGYLENITFGGKAIKFKSVDPNNWSVVDNTRIYGSVSLSSCPNESIISGLTITDSGGNGISCNNAKLTVNHCRIQNSGEYGIFCEGGAHATITDTYINNNSLEGIYIQNTANLFVDRCRINHNSNSGIYVYWGSAVVKNSIIHHNASTGIYLNGGTSFEIRNNTITDNNNLYNYGYGIYRGEYAAEPDINSNIIWGNEGGSLGSTVTFNKVNFNCIQNYTGSGTGNIISDPCFRDADANNYHLKHNSPCIDKGDPNFKDNNEVDIDGESRIMDGNNSDSICHIDIGADEFNPYDLVQDGFVDFLDFAVFADSWLKQQGQDGYNKRCNFYYDDNTINFKDFAVFAAHWRPPFDGSESMMSMQSEQESSSMQMEPPQEQMMLDVNLPPAIYLTCDDNTPEPNDEVTIWVHSDTSLLAMGIGIYIIGDMNITSAMNEADCNSFSWDNGWNSDPYIDPNGWVYLSGVKWVADANGTVGYVKFRYHSGQVSVYIDQEYSEAFAFDWDSQYSSYVPFSQETLYIRDPNEP